MSRDGNDDDQPGIFSAIGPEQCVQLLTEHSIGRVAWQAAEGPQILPVTYAWFEGTVAFRTSPYGMLSELMRPTEVASSGTVRTHSRQARRISAARSTGKASIPA